MQAVALDPNFALAHARLSSTCSAIFHFHEPLDSWKTKARAEAELAVRLQPNLAEAHLAVGQCAYWIDQDYERALQEFDRAAQLSPNNADVRVFIASIKRRQGHWQESLDTFETAQKLIRKTRTSPGTFFSRTRRCVAGRKLRGSRNDSAPWRQPLLWPRFKVGMLIFGGRATPLF